VDLLLVLDIFSMWILFINFGYLDLSLSTREFYFCCGVEGGNNEKEERNLERRLILLENHTAHV